MTTATAPQIITKLENVHTAQVGDTIRLPHRGRYIVAKRETRDGQVWFTMTSGEELRADIPEEQRKPELQPKPAPHPQWVPVKLVNAIAFNGKAGQWNEGQRYIKVIFEDEAGNTYNDIYNSRERDLTWLRANLKVNEWCWIAPGSRITRNRNRRGHMVFAYHSTVEAAA